MGEKTKKWWSSWRSINEFFRRQHQKTLEFESLDFEEVDNTLYREHHASTLGSRKKALAEFTLIFVFASLIAIVSYGIVHITEALLHFRNELVEEADLEGWVVGVVLSLVYSLIPAILCLCQPAALGSGMLDVIGFLNGVSPKAHISWKILIVRIIGMLGAVSSGLFTGFDGPMVSVGCMIAVLTLKYATKIKSISNLLYRTTELDYTDNKASVWKIAHHKRARIYGSIGTAAAMAATFRSPIGGVVFALEETVSHYEGNGMLLKLLYASVTAYLIGATLQKGYGLNQIAYSLFASDTNCEISLTVRDFANFVVMGVLAGLHGALYNRCLIFIRSFRDKLLLKRPVYRLLHLAVVIMITTCVVVYLPRDPNYLGACTPYSDTVQHVGELSCVVDCQLEGNVYVPLSLNGGCKDVCLTSNAQTNFDNLYTSATRFCAELAPNTSQPFVSSQPFVNTTSLGAAVFESVSFDFIQESNDLGCYYQLRTLLLSSPEHALELLLKRGVYNLFSAGYLAIFAVIYLFLSFLASGVALPTDLIIPNLIIGATLGRMWGIMTNYFKLRLGNGLIDPGNYAVLGMAGLWSGVAQLPLTVSVITTETTMDASFLAGIIVVSIMASATARIFGESMYHAELEVKGYPFLPSRPARVLKKTGVTELMTPVNELIVVSKMETKESLKEKMEKCPGNAFPVVEAMEYEVVDENDDEDKVIAENGDGKVETEEEEQEVKEAAAEPEIDEEEKIGNRGTTTYRLVGVVLKSQIKTCVFREFDARASLTAIPKSRKKSFARRRKLEKEQRRLESLKPQEEEKIEMVEIKVGEGEEIGGPIAQRVLKGEGEGGGEEKEQQGDEKEAEDEKKEITDAARADVDESTNDDEEEGSDDGKDKIGGDVVEVNIEENVDLTEIMNCSPMIVSESTTASKAYTVFRSLALRHMFVVNANGELQGLITRNSFVHFVEGASGHHHGKIRSGGIIGTPLNILGKSASNLQDRIVRRKKKPSSLRMGRV